MAGNSESQATASAVFHPCPFGSGERVADGFAADYPFEDMREASAWFDAVELHEADHRKIARTNAERLLRL